MSVIGSNILMGASGQTAGADYQISRSVRLRSSASGYFIRTPASAGNRKIWTWSGWVKRSVLGADQYIFTVSNSAPDATEAYLNFMADGTLRFGGETLVYRTTSQKPVDPSAWYHIVLVLNTTLATANDRVKLFINGTQVTSFGTLNNPAQNADVGLNKTQAHYIARAPTGAPYLDGYLTEINFIDGQDLTASSFGQIDATTGVWSPKQYTGTYGTNGFYLNFSDNSAATAAAIGKDYSGNGNNWTPNNISVTSGVTYDSMLDVPTRWDDGGNGRGNYAAIDPLMVSSNTISDGNLRVAAPASPNSKFVSSVPATTGKWYMEFGTSAWLNSPIGIAADTVARAYLGNADGSTSIAFWPNPSETQVYINNVSQSFSGSAITWATGDIAGFGLDGDAKTISIYKNGVLVGSPVSYSPYWTGPTYFAGGNYMPGLIYHANFGQRPFAYTPPAGFKALNTQNIPDGSVTTSGTFTGNLSTNGPVVWLNGVPTALTINGNAVTFGTHADRLATGFKVRSSSSSYNNSGSNTYSITTTGAVFKFANAQVNP